VLVQELDRVLDAEDVLVARVVDQVEHRGERSRLARTRRPGHQHEAAGLLRELLEHGRQAQRGELRHVVRDQAEGGGQRGALHVRVHAEASLARDRVGEVDLPVRLQALALLVREDRVDDLTGELRRHMRVVQRVQPAVMPDHGR
jgi:hypothetical protein